MGEGCKPFHGWPFKGGGEGLAHNGIFTCIQADMSDIYLDVKASRC